MSENVKQGSNNIASASTAAARQQQNDLRLVIASAFCEAISNSKWGLLRRDPSTRRKERDSAQDASRNDKPKTISRTRPSAFRE